MICGVVATSISGCGECTVCRVVCDCPVGNQSGLLCSTFHASIIIVCINFLKIGTNALVCMNVILLQCKHGGSYCEIKLHLYTHVHLLIFF
jgi:hypothetical protein